MLKWCVEMVMWCVEVVCGGLRLVVLECGGSVEEKV